MAQDTRRDKPSFRNPPTGAAQPVTNSVERAREHFKAHPEPAPPPPSRKNVWTRKPDPAEVEGPATEPDDNEPDREGEEDGKDES